MRLQPTFATLASGLRLHYRVQGTPGAPWLVLLNGLLSDTTMWAGVLPGLSDRFRILTFDSRGQGKSDAPLEGPYPTALLASEAWELFRALKIDRPWLIGLSNGSAMSLELLSAHPEAFPGAVLTSAMPHFDFAMSLKAEHWAHCLEVGGPLMQFDAVAPFLWGDRFLEARHGVLRAYHQVVTGGGKPQHGNLHQIRGTQGWDIRDRLARIQAPGAAARRRRGPADAALEVPGDGQGDPGFPLRGGARHRARLSRGGSRRLSWPGCGPSSLKLARVWPIRKTDLSCQQSRATPDSLCRRGDPYGHAH